MNRKMIEQYAGDMSYSGRLNKYEASGSCEEPGCGDVLEYTISTSREIVTEIGLDITDTACIPMKACANVAAGLAKGKPVMEAYLISADNIAEEVGGLDKENIHCAMMAELALKRTIINYSKNKARNI